MMLWSGRTIHGSAELSGEENYPPIAPPRGKSPFKCTSKLRKNELIGVIRNDLLRPERLEAVLYGLEEPEWILFQKCAAADAYPLKTAAQGMEGILPS
mgnify:CR=1 FL=1